MKRSTTPALKERNSLVKSTAHLKVASQLKIYNQSHLNSKDSTNTNSNNPAFI
jgi:hypothetical protein